MIRMPACAGSIWWRHPAPIKSRPGSLQLASPERELLRHTFNPEKETVARWDTGAQQLHGEPHPGNLLSTSRGPRFVDLHTCQRGPIEYDIAFVPEDVAALYAEATLLGLSDCRRRWTALQHGCDVPHCWPQLSPL
jgi:Ser/Thr protein kinase RdoA (MazF antagonist)